MPSHIFNFKLAPLVVVLILTASVAHAGYNYRIYTLGITTPDSEQLATISCQDPWGNPLSQGASVTAYRTGAVAFDQVCESESRRCQGQAEL